MNSVVIDPIVSNTIIYGSLVSMMCVGLTVTYMTTKVPNFAHSDFVVTGIYASALTYILSSISSPYLALPVSFVLGGAVAVLMYIAVLRPLARRGSTIVVLMVATLAVDILFTGILALFVPVASTIYSKQLLHRGYSLTFLAQLPDFKLFGESGLLYVAPAAMVAMTVGMYLLLNKTKFGVAMRASIENPNLARTVGINVDRVYVVSWFIAGALAGLAGGFYSIWSGTPQGFSALLIVDIFAGSILGGLGSIYGAIIGGLVVGAGETYIVNELSQLVSGSFGSIVGSQIINFQKGIPLAIMIVVLLLAPQGIVSINWRRLTGRVRT